MYCVCPGVMQSVLGQSVFSLPSACLLPKSGIGATYDAGGAGSYLISRTVQVVVEHLDPAVRPIGDVDDALAVDGYAVRRAELTVSAPALGAHFLHDVPVLVEFVDGRILVPITDERIALWIPRD